MLKSKLLAILALIVVLAGSLATVARAAVDLEYFRGRWDNGTVLLEWRTGSERDNAGFHIWRSDEPLPIVNGTIDTSRATRLTTNAILGPGGACNPLAADNYSYRDTTVDPGRQTYYYYLESRNCQASTPSTFYGDGAGGLRVTRAAQLLLYLPIVLNQR
jgi:hypothetical protein